MKRIAVLAIMTAVCATVSSGWTPAGAGAVPASATHSAASGALEAVPVKSGLVNPAGFTFLPDGRIVYGERNTGRVMLLDPQTGNLSVMYTITKVRTSGEGLLSLAVDPGWPEKPFIYAFTTRLVGAQDARTRQAQILRIRIADDVGVSRKIIWRLDTNGKHDGAHIAFGPDGKLYAAVGDLEDPANAQDLTNDAGKVLRMNRNGSVPKDNPFSGSLIFTYGLRNSFGFSFDPQSGALWETENGPECTDEINLEQAGENHGWGPDETCSGTEPDGTNQDGPAPRTMPLAWFTPTIAPTGLAFCEGCGITDADGALFFGAYNTGEIREIQLTSDRKSVAAVSVAYTFQGSVLSMQSAPDGGLYFSSADTIYQLVQT
jgi:glucose/arabinose dehydrogenase